MVVIEGEVKSLNEVDRGLKSSAIKGGVTTEKVRIALHGVILNLNIVLFRFIYWVCKLRRIIGIRPIIIIIKISVSSILPSYIMLLSTSSDFRQSHLGCCLDDCH